MSRDVVKNLLGFESFFAFVVNSFALRRFLTSVSGFMVFFVVTFVSFQ